MSLVWQQLIVGLILAACAAHLAWRGWQIIAGRRKAGCGSACGGCQSQKPVVTVDTLRSSAKQ
jgi:hypothetical protein